MHASKPGVYLYNIYGVSDDIYDLSSLNNLKDAEPVTIEQSVHKRPTAAFVERGKIYKACVNTDIDDSALEAIPIKFTGTPPFSVSLTIRHESQGKAEKKTIDYIEESTYNLNKVYQNLGRGRHSVAIGAVTDGNGCSRVFTKEEDRILIQVADVPSIAADDPKLHYCVGERVGFTLSGTPPFELTYDFNGKKQRVVTNSPFSRLAASPGNMTLLTLSDSASKCQVKLPHVVRHIHFLPSVSVIEGTSKLQNPEYDEADVVFKFEGTPPFSFTFTRSEMHGNRYEVLETHTVRDIEENEYVLRTKESGIYAAIAVEDAYCVVSH